MTQLEGRLGEASLREMKIISRAQEPRDGNRGKKERGKEEERK